MLEAYVHGDNYKVALKVVERLSKRDEFRFEALDREEQNYLYLEQALADDLTAPVIAPRYLGRYTDHEELDFLALELHGSSLKSWSELNAGQK